MRKGFSFMTAAFLNLYGNALYANGSQEAELSKAYQKAQKVGDTKAVDQLTDKIIRYCEKKIKAEHLEHWEGNDPDPLEECIGKIKDEIRTYPENPGEKLVG